MNRSYRWGLLLSLAGLVGAACLTAGPYQVEPRILILHGGEVPRHHTYTRNAAGILANQHLPFESSPIDGNPTLVRSGIGRYSILLFTDYGAYASLSPSKKAVLDRYCRTYGVGAYFLYVKANASLNGGELTTGSRGAMTSPRAIAGPVLYLTRAAYEAGAALPGWGVHFHGGKPYQSVLQTDARRTAGTSLMLDPGRFDGIRRIFNGHDFVRYWVGDLLFLDALRWLSPAPLPLMTSRWLGIDIDDIFQPNWDPDPKKQKVKIQRVDVEAILRTQARFSALIGERFRFNLGFNSGWYEAQYGEFPFDDRAGDRALVEARDQFFWFDHLPKHQSVLPLSVKDLISLMNESKAWASKSGVLPYMTRFQLTPVHFGIFPVHPPLYEAWRQVWGTLYSATTEIENGFVYGGVAVMPRKGCGRACWSDHYSFFQISRQEMNETIRLSVFPMLIDTPVATFMSHQSDYARDRIAIYLFGTLLESWKKWTNIRLRTGSNDTLARVYFSWLRSTRLRPHTD